MTTKNRGEEKSAVNCHDHDHYANQTSTHSLIHTPTQVPLVQHHNNANVSMVADSNSLAVGIWYLSALGATFVVSVLSFLPSFFPSPWSN